MNNFLIGFGVGLIGGMLFAPKSGSDMRHAIADGAGESMRHMKDMGAGWMDKASDMMGRTKEEMKEMTTETMKSSKPVHFSESGIGEPAFLG